MRTLHDAIVDAEWRGSHWLAEGNYYAERGMKAKAEKCYEKSQYWLDRANKKRDQEACLSLNGAGKP